MWTVNLRVSVRATQDLPPQHSLVTPDFCVVYQLLSLRLRFPFHFEKHSIMLCVDMVGDILSRETTVLATVITLFLIWNVA